MASPISNNTLYAYFRQPWLNPGKHVIPVRLNPTLQCHFAVVSSKLSIKTLQFLILSCLPYRLSSFVGGRLRFQNRSTQSPRSINGSTGNNKNGMMEYDTEKRFGG